MTPVTLGKAACDEKSEENQDVEGLHGSCFCLVFVQMRTGVRRRKNLKGFGFCRLSNFMLFFKLNTDDRIEKVIRHYLNSYLPKNTKMVDKIRWYKNATQDHHFIVLDTLNGDIFRTKIVA